MFQLFFYLNPDTWELVLAFNFFIGAPISEFYATIVLSFLVSRVDYKFLYMISLNSMLVISEFYAKIIYDIHTIYIVCISNIIFILHLIFIWKKGEREKRRKKQILIYELI